jgi:hypothetical protein
MVRSLSKGKLLQILPTPVFLTLSSTADYRWSTDHSLRNTALKYMLKHGKCIMYVNMLRVARFQVLTAARTKMTAFWGIITLMVEAGSTSEKAVYFYKTTWHKIPQGCHLHNFCNIFRNLNC